MFPPSYSHGLCTRLWPHLPPHDGPRRFGEQSPRLLSYHFLLTDLLTEGSVEFRFQTAPLLLPLPQSSVIFFRDPIHGLLQFRAGASKFPQLCKKQKFGVGGRETGFLSSLLLLPLTMDTHSLGSRAQHNKNSTVCPPCKGQAVASASVQEISTSGMPCCCACGPSLVV